MNKTSIKTYEDLKAETDRLEALLVVQRQRVIDDWNEVKEELEPVNTAFGLVGKITNSDKSNPLLNMGLKFASDLLLKNFIFAKAGWITRLAVPFVMKNYSSHLLAENGKEILDKIKGLGRLFKSHKNKTMSSQDKKVVNTEEQNRVVNPVDDNTREEASLKPKTADTANDNFKETEKMKGGSQIDTPENKKI